MTATNRSGEGMTAGPIAGPIAPTGAAVSPLAEGESLPEMSANSGAPRGTTTHTRPPRRRYTTASDIDDIADQLSDRDHAILRSVEQHQFLAARHIQALHFADIAPSARGRITRRTSARLRDLRALGTLERRIGGVWAGSQGLVYFVDVTGDRILHQRSGRRGRRTHEPTARFLNHRLAIADTHTALIDADRRDALELVDSALEPAAWRHFTGIGAARRILKPDLYAETATAGGLVHAWFIEIDRGTESIPTLITKCREYDAYRQSGIEQDRHGAFPLVIWSVTHTDEQKAIRRRIALEHAIASDRTVTSALFRVIAPDQLVPLMQRGGTA